MHYLMLVVIFCTSLEISWSKTLYEAVGNSVEDPPKFIYLPRPGKRQIPQQNENDFGTRTIYAEYLPKSIADAERVYMPGKYFKSYERKRNAAITKLPNTVKREHVFILLSYLLKSHKTRMT